TRIGSPTLSTPFIASIAPQWDTQPIQLRGRRFLLTLQGRPGPSRSRDFRTVQYSWPNLVTAPRGEDLHQGKAAETHAHGPGGRPGDGEMVGAGGPQLPGRGSGRLRRHQPRPPEGDPRGVRHCSFRVLRRL